MIETIISGLVLATVSGLAFLAYKHHEGYKVISKPLKQIALILYFGGFAYYLGFSDGKYSKDGEMFFSFGWMIVSCLAFWIFIGILDYLPELTKRENNKDEE